MLGGIFGAIIAAAIINRNIIINLLGLDAEKELCQINH
jgi:hypothetical protein